METIKNMEKICIEGIALEYAYIRAADAHQTELRPVIVMLHEALGSVRMWRDFPQRLSDFCGCDVLVYSRGGYGWSDPVPPRQISYMHHEGQVVLPQLLQALEIERPVLFGHSDGSSIALICAGSTQTPLAGVVVLAPHEFVEEEALIGIREAKERYEQPDGRFRSRLGRYHADVDDVFSRWWKIWLSDAFRSWDITSCLSDIHCPVLAIQGENDEYGTLRQIDIIAEKASNVTLLALPQCGHSPHKDQPQAVLEATRDFIDRLTGSPRRNAG